jgi:hypothetical protein
MRCSPKWTLAAVLAVGACSAPTVEPAPDTAVSSAVVPAKVTAPPVNAGFDYQIGGAYAPPAGVQVISRDHAAAAVPGLYNICYVNAFQAQPGAEGEWGDLVLRDGGGNTVIDKDWNEALLDLRGEDKRAQVAARILPLVDDCAAHGYQAVEPDNYDSYTRSSGLLTEADAEAYVRLLSAHTHAKGLAIGQKNTAELAARHAAAGLDFAVVEECGEQDNCDEYTSAFGDHVIVIEYTAKGLDNACRRWGSVASIVQRDRSVVPVGQPGYVRRTC